MAGMINANLTGFPKLNTPFTDKNGIIEIPWYRFLVGLYNRTGGSGSVFINGTSGRIDVSQTDTGYIVNIDPTYVGQTSISKIGTITTGTWRGSVVQVLYGGTGSPGIPAGLVTSNGLQPFQSVSIVGSPSAITVVNGNGQGGNPTINLAPALDFTSKIITEGTYNTGTFNDGTFVDGTYTGGTYTGGTFVSGNFNGTVGADTPSTGAFTTISASGLLTTNGQIKFPAVVNPSSDPNTLDDYREGDAAPGIQFGGSSTGVTYDPANGGTYTKVGRLVTWSFRLVLSSKGTSTGPATITGLPFPVASTNGRGGGYVTFYANMPGITTPIMVYAGSGNSFIQLFQAGTSLATKTSVEELTKQVEKTKELNTKLERDFNDKKTIIDDLKKAVDENQKKETETSKTTDDGLKADVEASKTAISDLKSTVDDNKSKITELKSGVEDGKNKIADLRTDVDAGKSKIVDLRTDVDAEKSKIAVLMEEIIQKNTEIANLKTDIEDSKKKLEKVNSNSNIAVAKFKADNQNGLVIPIPSGFSSHEIIIHTLKPSSIAALYMQISIDGGSSYVAEKIAHNRTITVSDAQAEHISGGSNYLDTQIQLTGGQGPSSKSHISGRIELNNAANTISYKRVAWRLGYSNPSYKLVRIEGSGEVQAEKAITHVKLFHNDSINIETADVTLMSVI